MKSSVLLNEDIAKVTDKVRCIGDDGTQYDIIPIGEAIDIAYKQGYDVVLVSPNANPPVVKLMDYNKFRYQEDKKRKEAKKKQKQIEIKEIKMTPKIAQNDINYKVKHSINFLNSGKHVRFKVFLKGREIATPDVAHTVLAKVKEMIEGIGEIEKPPNLEGRYVTMYVIPSKEKTKKEVKNAKDENL